MKSSQHHNTSRQTVTQQIVPVSHLRTLEKWDSAPKPSLLSVADAFFENRQHREVIGTMRQQIEGKVRTAKMLSPSDAVILARCSFSELAALLDGYDERAAILEFDAGMPCRDAERLSWQSIWQQIKTK